MSEARAGAVDKHWQSDRGLTDANAYMLEKQLYTDIQFNIRYPADSSKDGMTLGAHTYVLVSRSPVFERMMHGSLPLAEEERNHGILITDIPADIFMLFLRFLYYEHLELTPLNVIPLLYTSQKYMVKTLERRCSEYLQTLTNAENACLILEQSLLYEEKELIKTAEKLIQMNTFEVLESEAFRAMGRTALCALLNIPSLSCSEKDVFVACLSWAKNQCRSNMLEGTAMEMRQFLQPALGMIHFGSITAEEFGGVVMTAGVFTNEEIEEIHAGVMGKGICTKFKTSQRTKYQGFPIRFLFECSYGMMQRSAMKEMHVILKPNLPVMLKQIVLDLENYKRSDFALMIFANGQIYRPVVKVEGDFGVDVNEVKVEAGSEVKIELMVRSLLPITVTVQNTMTLVTEVKQLDTKLEIAVIEASRGAGAVFKSLKVMPLGL